MSSNGSSSSSSSSSERSENSEPQGVDEYNGMGSDSAQDSSSWNLDDYGRSNNASDDDDLPPLQIHESTTTLRDHLTSQLRMTAANQRDRALVTFLIESLDEDGYLTSSLDEVQTDLPEELEVDLDELSAALALLQSFDPPGVGGRSASECLKLQLLRLDGSPTRTLALDIVTNHLELLAARDFTRLRKQLKANDDDAARRACADQIARAVPGRRVRQERSGLCRAGHHRAKGGERLDGGTESGDRAEAAHQPSVREHPAQQSRRSGQRLAASATPGSALAHQEYSAEVSRRSCVSRRRSSSVRRTFLHMAKSPCGPWFCGRLLIRWAYTNRRFLV